MCGLTRACGRRSECTRRSRIRFLSDFLNIFAIFRSVAHVHAPLRGGASWYDLIAFWFSKIHLQKLTRRACARRTCGWAQVSVGVRNCVYAVQIWVYVQLGCVHVHPKWVYPQLSLILFDSRKYFPNLLILWIFWIYYSKYLINSDMFVRFVCVY